MRIPVAIALPIAIAASCGQASPQRALAAAAPEAGIARLASDAEDRWVQFDLTPGNQIRFPLTLDGRTLTAILDTGVSVTVLSRKSIAVDATRLRSGGQATAIGGQVAIDWMATREIAIGGLTLTGASVAVTALPALATGSGAAVDMLVGRDLIGGQALDIDYAHRRFRLIASGRLPFTGATAPLTISPQRLVYESAITLGARTLKPMIVDTGDGAAITVTQAGWAAAGLTRLPATSAIAYGLAGPLVTTLAIVPTLRVGTLEAASVEVRVEGDGGFSKAVGAAGRIGSGFLQNYRVLLDPGAGRMVFQPGPGANRAPLRSTSGLLLGLERDRLKVLHVMANGPAAAAGWREGETICSVDGTPIAPDYPASPLAAWSVGAPGRIVRLGVCGGAERTLRLANFY
ncbi:aspartyl protease family protein [Sphingomonas sp.]|uniref:retropepsin-like aspartic protease n=1 Tax=Sphingomonas sp. TaxID=28214 RepID=UPI0035BBDAF8